MTIGQPNTSLATAWKKIPKYGKVTFFVTFAAGLLMHLFMFTNKLPNHDDLGQLIDTMDLSMSGRWFLKVPAAISSIFSLPWVNGLLAIFYITVAACFVVTFLNIKQSFYAGLTGCLMMAFPTVAVSFTYMQSADAYFFALMLICIGVYLAGNEKKWHWLVAVLLMTLSLGCYQAYFGVAVGLMIISLILQLLNVRIPWQKTVWKGLRFLGILSLSMGLYFISVKVMTPSEGLTAYMGINQMGKISLAEIPRMIAKAYWYIFNYFLLDRRNVHYPFMAYVFALAFLLCIILVGHFCHRQKLYREPLRLILLAVFLLLLPLGGNIIYVMSPSDVHMVMIYGTVILLVFLPAIMAAVTAAETEAKGAVKQKLFENLVCWVITLSLVLCSFNYFITTNQIYFKLFLAYEQVDAESARLISRIQDVEEYSYQTKIVFVGTPYRGLPNYQVGIPELGSINMTGAANTLELFSGNLLIHFLRRYQNFTQEMEYVPETVALDSALADAIIALPQYPDHGSVAFIDGDIYVKFSYQPTP